MKTTSKIRTLGFHYHIPIEEINGDLMTPAYFGFFIDSLAPHFEKLVCFMHSKGDLPVEMDYKVINSNVELVNLGPHDSIIHRKLNFIKNRPRIKERLKEIDFMLIRASTPLLKNFHRMVGERMALMLVSNAVDGLDQLEQPAWRLALIKYWAHKYQQFEDELSKRLLTLVNSQRLLEDHKEFSSRLFRIKTTTLSKGDFVERVPDFSNKGIKLLYTGRVAPNKGIQEIVEAILDLRSFSFKLELKVVGPYSKEDGFYKSLVKKINEAGLSNQVDFVGYVTAGPQLLEYYRSSDIFIMASRSSAEGFPRVLWEAMASSLPIIASRVSGIDKVLDGRAEFFIPADAQDLKRALLRVISDKETRENRISLAREMAEENTLENSGKYIAELINKFAL